MLTPGRGQTKTLKQSTKIDKKSLEAEFSIAICHPTGDKWQSKTLFLAIFDPCSSIVKSVFDCQTYLIHWDMGQTWHLWHVNIAGQHCDRSSCQTDYLPLNNSTSLSPFPSSILILLVYSFQLPCSLPIVFFIICNFFTRFVSLEIKSLNSSVGLDDETIILKTIYYLWKNSKIFACRLIFNDFLLSADFFSNLTWLWKKWHGAYLIFDQLMCKQNSTRSTYS